MLLKLANNQDLIQVEKERYETFVVESCANNPLQILLSSRKKENYIFENVVVVVVESC